MAFAIPQESRKYSQVIEVFRGVDLNNSPTNVDPSRSPAAPNMIRDQVGKVRKRMGYKTVATAPGGGAVNGFYRLGEERIVHAGDRLYRWDGADGWTELGQMAAERSRGFVYDEKLYLLDGQTYQVYDGKALTAVTEAAYIPTVIISRNPNGGGSAYQKLNLLSRAWREDFKGTETDTAYQLTTAGLDGDAVKAEVMNSSGDWVEKKEGTDFTVDRIKGTVTFKTAPGKPPVTGQDNVRITAWKTREGYAGKIDRCRVFAIYGVGGVEDRVFLSGDPEAPGVDYYSGYDDPTYFPDSNYTRLSRDGSAVVGYAVINDALGAFLSGSDDGRNVVIRTGSLDNSGEAMFRISNTLMGQSAVSPDSFAYGGKEPLFLTRRGVYTITAEELTGEKYGQERSYYIAEAIKEAKGKEDAFGIVYRDFYVLSLGGTLYLLDLQQRTAEANRPYSSYQYECYYFPNIPARVLWTEGEALCFGDGQGRIRRFGANVDDPESYHDDGEAIEAYWETCDFDGNTFFKSKTFTSVSCRLAAAKLTGVKIFAQKRGLWNQVYDAQGRARYFDWEYLDFEKFVFSADRTPRTLFGKIKLKKVDKVRFRLLNGEKNEPFGLYMFGFEWKEPGSSYKR